MKLFKTFTTLALSSILLAIAGTANATSITRIYGFEEAAGAVSGGAVTWTQSGQTLTISIDNTTTGALSSAITGIVFDIDQDISAANIVTFKDGNNTDIPNWSLDFNAGGSITPGNTTVDIYFARGNIKEGIYNVANNPQNINNLVPDIAVLTLTVTNPASWTLNANGISNDILRMQRTGLDGKGSLKLPGTDPGTPTPDPIPLPGTLLLLGAGLLGLRLTRRKAR